MKTTMADGASERLDAQIADALFGQPGMSKMDVANRLRQLRGDGGALLGSAAYPAAWMWPHPEDGSVRFTADGDVATEAASMGRAVSALYRVPVQEDAQPSPTGQGDALAALQQEYDNLLAAFDRQVEAAEKIAATALEQDARIEELEEALAARQPVGQEPAAVVTTSDRFTYGKLNRELPDGTGLYIAPPERAWVVADGQVARWRMWGSFGPAWTSDRDQALHFARRADAEAFANDDEDACMIQPIGAPAQGVDLGLLPGYEPTGSDGMNMERVADGRWVKRDDVLALIDSKAVGNG